MPNRYLIMRRRCITSCGWSYEIRDTGQSPNVEHTRLFTDIVVGDSFVDWLNWRAAGYPDRGTNDKLMPSEI